MFKIITTPSKLERLEVLALPHVMEKLLRDASKLSHKLGTDVYVYHFPGHREIKKTSKITYLDEQINLNIMKDDRIAVEDADCLSAILRAKIMIKYFKQFHT